MPIQLSGAFVYEHVPIVFLLVLYGVSRVSACEFLWVEFTT